MAVEVVRFSNLSQFRSIYGIDSEFIPNGLKSIASPDQIKEVINGNLPQVLYLDGITSAGKTTLLDNLQIDMPDAHFIPETLSTIPIPYRNIGSSRSIIDQLRAEFWFYNQYVKKDSEIKKRQGTVVVDRGLLGLFCYSNLLSEQQEVSLRIMVRALQRRWIPGLYVFLTAEPQILKGRLLSRKDTARIKEEDWDNGLGDYIKKLHNSVQEVSQNAGVQLVDTSHLSPDEVKTIVKNSFNQFYEN